MTNNTQVTTDELYHVFVPYQIAKQGVTQKFTSRTGKIYEVNIPANCTEGSQIRLDKTSSSFLNKISDLFSQKTVLNQKYSVITLHTLFEQNDNIDKMIFKLINNAEIKFEGKSATESLILETVQTVYKSVKKASSIVPNATTMAQATGIKAGTGVAISSLSGGAATNATLAFLGGGSVAAGGLGMLGGLVVATGGAALIGAAALVSVASLTQMDSEDHKNLGIATGIGVATSAAALSTAWAAVGAFGVASTGTAISTLYGAAAYSASMAFLGGIGLMTGGSATVAFVAGFAAWKFLKGDKNDPKKILKQLEAKLYS